MENMSISRKIWRPVTNIPLGTCMDYAAKKKQQAKQITDQKISVADGQSFSAGSKV
jgi:hypothetical protein